MISIERRGIGYKIKITDGALVACSLFAKSSQEAVNSVAHYYNLEHDKNKCASCAAMPSERVHLIKERSVK